MRGQDLIRTTNSKNICDKNSNRSSGFVSATEEIQIEVKKVAKSNCSEEQIKFEEKNNKKNITPYQKNILEFLRSQF